MSKVTVYCDDTTCEKCKDGKCESYDIHEYCNADHRKQRGRTAPNEINLEWYVLNGTRMRSETEKFNKYPYSFRETNIRPWNVFNNWKFREQAIKLAGDYYNKEIEDRTWRDDYPTGGSDFEKFKFILLTELSHEEHARTEYEICVADWPPTYVDKYGNRINIYYGHEHEPIEGVKMDKIDCYSQVLPNADIFAKYVLMTVNGTLEQNHII